jgi:glutamine amidotransferase
MIALIDYGAGNLTSVRKALAALGADVHIPGAPDELAEAAGVIVPGVGNFKATAAITDEWRKAIIGVVGKGRPLLGICLGLQWLFAGSTEAPECPGLGLMEGQCDRLPSIMPDSAGQSLTLKIPHVGCISPTPMQRPPHTMPRPSPRTEFHSPQASSAARCSGCSFIRRNQATLAFKY